MGRRVNRAPFEWSASLAVHRAETRKTLAALEGRRRCDPEVEAAREMLAFLRCVTDAEELDVVDEGGRRLEVIGARERQRVRDMLLVFRGTQVSGAGGREADWLATWAEVEAFRGEDVALLTLSKEERLHRTRALIHRLARLDARFLSLEADSVLLIASAYVTRSKPRYRYGSARVAAELVITVRAFGERVRGADGDRDAAVTRVRRTIEEALRKRRRLGS